MEFRAAWNTLWGREVKESQALRTAAVVSQGRPIWTPRDYDNLAEEGFQKNVVAFRSITEVARGLASVPWKLFSLTTKDRTEIQDENHPLLTLLRRPNPLQGGSEFFEAVTSYLLIAGNSYIERSPEQGVPLELWSVRPDRMRVVPGRSGLPASYVYRVGGSRTRWDANPVTGDSAILHVRTFHPRNDWYGMSALEAAARGVDMRNAADDWNVSLIQNHARPSGVLAYDPKDGPATLDDTQYERLKLQIEQGYSGSKAGRPMLLDGGLSWQAMGFSPTDMDWLNSKNTSSRDITLAFGVPPMLLGIPGDNTFSNYKEARLALWEETIIPWLRHVRDELNHWLTPMFGENLMLDFDLNEIPALSVRRESVWSNAQTADFLTINEKRKLVGMDDVEGGDVVLVPSTLLPLGFEPEEDEPEPPDDDEQDENEDDEESGDNDDGEDEDENDAKRRKLALLAYGAD